MRAKDYLGKGWAFPVGVNRATGQVRLSEYEQDIAEAIRIILTTRRGERIMRPDFGSRVHEYAFEPDSLSVRTRIEAEVLAALEEWEPRITDTRAEVRFAKGEASGFVVELSYIVHDTNNPFNLVVPFYEMEGMA